MRLFLYMKKAVQSSTSGVDTPLEDESVAHYDSSYSRRYEGEAAGEAYDPDDPKVGGHWPSDGKSNLDETEANRKAKKVEKSDFFAVIPPDDEKVDKGLDLLKSLTNELEEAKRKRTPNPVEVRFLTEVMGYSQTQINKGLVSITGRTRHLFNEWLCSRLAKSVNDLLPGGR